ncbi:LysR family transcriptional regulator (plasmid) [Pantoea agglomerans]|nr:LysR family transcriptional regulator [Pantoea agglomerans]QAV52288.1 LysR family transcriptional regulator [Pantoea agglomerans]
MELRHLRCFLAAAEELHFARAVKRLHILRSPLSRAIKELEEELGVVLLARTTRSTRISRAGKPFLEHVPRVFAALDQARGSVTAPANGFHAQLRIALSDGMMPARLPTLLAQGSQDGPEVDIRLFEVSLAKQIKGLHQDMYDVGFAQSNEVGDGILAEPVWHDPLAVAAWSQLASAAPDENFAIFSAWASSGVFHPSVSRGRPLSRRTMSLSSVWLAIDRSLPLGRN